MQIIDAKHIKFMFSFSGISSLCFTNNGEALYMMSSSELQRIALATSKVVQPTGIVEIEPLETAEDSESATNEDEDSDKEIDKISDALKNISEPVKEPPVAQQRSNPLEILNVENNSAALVNGIHRVNSVNLANETITSSIGDITVDSVRDHLNTTTTTLCSTTTEETVGMYSSNLNIIRLCFVP